MSDPPPQPIMRDTLVREARTFGQLITLAETHDPHLAAVLTEHSLIASKTMWAPPVIGLVTWAAYGLDLDAQTCALIAGVLIWAGTAVLRYFSTGTIGSVLPAKAP